MDPVIRAAFVSATVRRLRQSPIAPTAAVPPVAQATSSAQQSAMDAELQLRALRQQMAESEAARAAAHLADQAALAERAAEAQADAEQRGLVLGMEQAKASAQALVQEQLDLLAAVTASLQVARERVLQESEDVMVEIVFGAVCRVIGDQAAGREAIVAQVRAQMHGKRADSSTSVKLHPDDVELLRGSGLLPAALALVPDASITLGGCKLDSATGTLDATLDTQLLALRDVLAKTRAARRQQEPGAT